ncbi:MAG: HAMP domain-containing protein [Leptonema illini]|uniref:HAMP domain-containing protein n=1 Tax=Leptonema illini TaxID=183 RepID=A0A833M1Z9_9LEPT|nr:MAG: HAMP domain-containing protein [Leptonema illini]
MEKGRIRFRSGFALYHDPSLDDKFSSEGADGIARRVRRWKRNQVSLLVLAPDLKWMGSDELSEWHRICREEGMPILLASVASLTRPDFSYFRRLNQELRTHLWKGHVLFLHSQEASAAVRGFLPTLLIHPVEISPDRAAEVVDGPEAPEEVRKIVADYARSIHPYLPQTAKTMIGKPGGRFSIRRKLLSIITGIVVLSSVVIITLTGDLFKKLSTVLIQDYNLSLSRMIGDALDSDLDNVYAWGRLLGSGQESPQSFFAKNASAVSVALLKRDGKTDTVKAESIHLNEALSKDYGVTEAEMISLLQSDKSDEFFNASPDVPVFSPFVRADGSLLLILSLWLDSEDTVQLIVLSPERLFARYRSARQTEIFRLLLVDGQGRLISATDGAIQKIEDLPIVQSMLRSPVDNGSQLFESEGHEYLGSFRILKNGFGVISLVPADRAFEAVFRVQRQNILIVVMILTVAFIIVYLFSRTLTLPIVELLHAARRIEQGDYAVQIKPSTRDEIGSLTVAFMQMVHGLRERQKIKEEFGKFVNPEIAERAIQGSLRLGGEKKHCTVLFTDIRGFTQFSESRQPEEVVDFLNRYFTAMVDSVTVTDGVVDKFIGDAIMAHWGALLPQKDEAKRAVNSALLMRQSLIDLNHSFALEGIPHINFGLGINTGPVIAGQVGSEKRLEFTVIGDAVNLASRIEYLNKEFGTDILISESTRRILGDDYRLVAMPSVPIRGKAEPQLTYAVLGRKNDSEAPRSLKQLREQLRIAYRPGMPEGSDEP